MTNDDIMRILDQAEVSLAAGPDCYWHRDVLEPHLWEALRIEMQRRLRRSTGEPDAVVTFSFGESAMRSREAVE